MRGNSDDDKITRIKALGIGRCRIFVQNEKDVFHPVGIGLSVWVIANPLLFALLPVTPGSAFADGVSARL